MTLLKARLSRGKYTAFRFYGRSCIISMIPRDCFDSEDSIYELTHEAAYIWRLLENNPTGDEIINSFIKKYKLKREAAKEKVTSFLKKMISQKMIEISSERKPSKTKV